MRKKIVNILEEEFKKIDFEHHKSITYYLDTVLSGGMENLYPKQKMFFQENIQKIYYKLEPNDVIVNMTKIIPKNLDEQYKKICSYVIQFKPVLKITNKEILIDHDNVDVISIMVGENGDMLINQRLHCGSFSKYHAFSDKINNLLLYFDEKINMHEQLFQNKE